MIHKTLIDTETVAAHLHHPNWLLFDCRASLAEPDAGLRQYAQGHLPGAVHVHLEQDLSAPHQPGRSGRHPLPDRAELLQKLRDWGVNPDSQLVTYDAGPGMFAARFWWLLRWLGHDAVAVLDGGLKAWQAAGQPVTTDIPTREPGTISDRPPLTRTLSASDIEQDLAHSTAPSAAADTRQSALRLIDARGQARFEGREEPLDPVAGRIPGAICLPFEGNLDDSGHFQAPERLRERFAADTRDSAQQVVHYCGSGVTAMHNLLAMVHAGLPEPALYPGSWSEWITDPDRPIARGPAD